PPNCSSCDTWNINVYGNYFVVVENSNGCQGISNTIKVVESCGGGCSDPQPYLISSDSLFLDCGKAQANINYNPNNLTILNEFWNFPNGAIDPSITTGTTATASASFEEAGVYTFNYQVSYGDGTCAKIFDQDVYVPFVGDLLYTA